MMVSDGNLEILELEIYLVEEYMYLTVSLRDEKLTYVLSFGNSNGAMRKEMYKELVDLWRRSPFFKTSIRY